METICFWCSRSLENNTCTSTSLTCEQPKSTQSNTLVVWNKNQNSLDAEVLSPECKFCSHLRISEHLRFKGFYPYRVSFGWLVANSVYFCQVNFPDGWWGVLFSMWQADFWSHHARRVSGSKFGLKTTFQYATKSVYPFFFSLKKPCWNECNSECARLHSLSRCLLLFNCSYLARGLNWPVFTSPNWLVPEDLKLWTCL